MERTRSDIRLGGILLSASKTKVETMECEVEISRKYTERADSITRIGIRQNRGNNDWSNVSIYVHYDGRVVARKWANFPHAEVEEVEILPAISREDRRKKL